MNKLSEAVSQMAEYQLGKKLSPKEVAAIITYLHSLTGAIPAEFIKPPVLPSNLCDDPEAGA